MMSYIITGTMVDVIRDVYIPVELDSKDLLIETDSNKGSYDMVIVWFYTDNDQYAGDLLHFSTAPPSLPSPSHHQQRRRRPG